MNEGADKMRVAADVFVTANNSLTNVTEVNSTLFKEVNQISGSLITSCSQLKSVLTDSQRVQDTVDKAINILQDLVASTHYETDMHSQIIVDMKAMTSALAGVRAETKDYLDEVSHVLGKGFDDFSGSVERSLVKTLGIFDNTLDQSVQHLASGVKDLGEVAEELAEMANRNKRH
jgi:DNA anti-recombination protein RmuC